MSDARKNNILFKRLLFDYDEELQLMLAKFIKSKGKEPPWLDLTITYPELKYIAATDQDPISIAAIVLREITL
jgi:hypothetical protein